MCLENTNIKVVHWICVKYVKRINHPQIFISVNVNSVVSTICNFAIYDSNLWMTKKVNCMSIAFNLKKFGYA